MFFTRSKICLTFTAGTQPSLRILMTPVGQKYRPELEEILKKKEMNYGESAEGNVSRTFINPQTVHHSGSNGFI